MSRPEVAELVEFAPLEPCEGLTAHNGRWSDFLSETSPCAAVIARQLP